MDTTQARKIYNNPLPGVVIFVLDGEDLLLFTNSKDGKRTVP
jgi:hypothetical protein